MLHDLSIHKMKSANVLADDSFFTGACNNAQCSLSHSI